MSFHDLSFVSIGGASQPLRGFAGKAVLVVNTASECGFTPQYAELERLWRRERDNGLVVLGVPCNDFGAQEPGSESEIQAFCRERFQVSFPMTAKVKVLGPEAHPFYRRIVETLGEDAAPRWNFHKYLLDRAGALAGAWPSRVKPEEAEIAGAVAEALAV